MEAPPFPSKRKPPQPHSSSTATTAAAYFPTSYDDVFGGPPKFTTASSTLAPRAEDYSEIFSGFRTSSSSRAAASSSIPVLDLPAVQPDHFDSSFDYQDVFGGLHTVDFALPFHQLFRSSHGFDASDDDDAWTLVGTESLSDDSDPFAFSEKSQCFLNGIINKPTDDKQYNVSYHKVHPGPSTCVPDTIHVTQLNDVPGYTCVDEESTSLRKMGGERSCTPVVEDIVLNVAASPTFTQKHVKKTSSHLSHGGAGLKTSDSDPNLSSHFTPPSTDARSLPVSAERYMDINGSSSATKPCESGNFVSMDEGSLPPFFDMEVDASSSAAASAAAMKDVMEKAQAKLKAAREFRVRKDTLQIDGEVGLETDVNGGESTEMVHTECVSKAKKLHATNDGGANKMKSCSKARHGRNNSQITPDPLADPQVMGADEKPARIKSNFPMDTAFTDTGGEWKEAGQYFEIVNINSRDGKSETFKQQDNNDTDSDSAGESCVTQTNRRKLKATKAVSRQGYYEKMIKVAQEVHDTVTSGHKETKEGLQDTSLGGNKERKPKLIVEPEKYEGRVWDTHQAEAKYAEVNVKAETKKGLQDIFHGGHKEQKPKLIVEPEKNEGRVWDTHQAEIKYAEVNGKAEAEMKPKNVLGDETMETRETDVSYRDANGTSRNDHAVNTTKESAYNRERERRVKGTDERAASGNGAHEGVVELSTGPLKQRNKDSRHEKDKRSEIYGEEKLKTFERKEKGMTEDMHKMKTECWRSTETLEDRAAKDRLKRTCEVQEYCQTTESQEILKHEKHLKKSVNGQGSEMMLDQNFELEKCWEYLETLEQEKSRLNMDNGHKLVDENSSVERQKKDEKDEKLDQTAESKLNLAGNLGDSVNLDEKANFMEDQNGSCKSHMETKGEDEDQEPDRSSYIELSMNDKYQKLPSALNGKDVELDAVPCMLKSPHTEVNGFLEVFSGKENADIGTTLVDDNKLKGFETADVQFDYKELRSAAPQVCLSDKELEEKADPSPPKMSQMNDDISTVLSEKNGPKSGETNDVIDERQTMIPEAQVSSDDDEHHSSPVYASHTLDMNEKITKSGEAFARHEQIKINEKRKVSPVSDPKLVKASHLELGGMTRNQRVTQVFSGEDENFKPAQSERMNGSNEHPSKRVTPHSLVADKRPSAHRTFQVCGPGQNIEINRKMKGINGSLEEEDEDKERDPEKEHLRKLEEEREREREREKDKMAVETAIREARERAYADARDRAERVALERATEEVRQKAMADARERLEKACAEARERSSGNKASDAKLRAERAAVERATAEARQRAMEKSLADRAMFETRERVQRSVSEKFTSERDVITRQSTFPSTSERFETGSSEPAERGKARLERHRRTVERVANALAEKNMRDLLAQREQAERNRFAETLDADVKRWSSGKTGNLRALLSTLQYILGPDSGWQPVPLTEVITAAAVKKAYRKATLCVHPDKLQQRGASIQQKYISEKVFDLLKVCS
ncbi:hypothetical protein KSS87_023531 [Heliosperma pusillum]|nr:hypothetical protein KSS87_023531 [Heliosperma pusillum]